MINFRNSLPEDMINLIISYRGPNPILGPPATNCMKEFINIYHYSWLNNKDDISDNDGYYFNDWFFHRRKTYFSFYKPLEGQLKNYFVPIDFDASYNSMKKLKDYYIKNPVEFDRFKINSPILFDCMLKFK